MEKITIAVDAMSGDAGATVVVSAAISILERYKNVHIILVGDEAIINSYININNNLLNRLQIVHASSVINMQDSPLKVLRSKKDSSMHQAILLVKQKIADAMISAGNTGALMLIARYYLKMIPGVDRPAIIGYLPSFNKTGFVRILDLGANSIATAEHLLQFAIMGSVAANLLNDIKSPRIALLNIGEEKIKGNILVQDAANLIEKNKKLNYIGFVEGNDIFNNLADVIVCDGFVGNVTLKTTEGASRFISSIIKESFHKNTFSKTLGFMSKVVWQNIYERLDPARYNGASLLGVNGVVIKCHGSSNAVGFSSAIEHTISEVENNVLSLLSARISSEFQ